MAASKNLWETSAHQSLLADAESIKKVHLKDLLNDDARTDALWASTNGIHLDYCRGKVTLDVMKHLSQLASELNLKGKIEAMFEGQKINSTENRSVLHVALRSQPSDTFVSDGKNVVPEVQKVLDSISDFSSSVRSGKVKGYTGKAITDVVCIGIGGSYLGPEFVYEALRTEDACRSSTNIRLRFLANVDPIDVRRALSGLDAESTMAVVVSKTFTTAETMLNARTVKEWLLSKLGGKHEAISKHMVAVSTNIKATSEFGIAAENVFGFWDWVGGRFSVCSAVGCLPLSLAFGFDQVRQFLDGCREIDLHFRSAPLEQNLPVLMGLLSLWNSTYLNYSDVAILPYCQGLHRFAAHIQQLTMESNGKRVTIDGTELPMQAGEVFFGEPGTNGQHSFYQLLHQGRVVPAEFIGFVKSQNPIAGHGEIVSNHDELMSNFFAQPDALALGKSAEQCKNENVPDSLIPHKIFVGDRPSSSLLLPICSPRYVGALLALYEHRTAVQGFLWGINSFDQWGVELGKVLASNVRKALGQKATGIPDLSSFPKATQRLLEVYLKEGSQ